MDKKRFRIIMALIFVAVTGLLLFCSKIYICSKTVHPDGIVTQINPTTNQRVQAYAIGKMQVYIDMAYRMDLPVWNMYLRSIAEQYGHDVPELNGKESVDLALNRDNSENDINPFILRLTIKNISNAPLTIDAKNFSLRTMNDDIIAPDLAWAKVLDEVGFFAGTGNSKTLDAGESKTLWLVYGAPSTDNTEELELQEYVRINYGSDNSLFSTKVEFPFNYTLGFPIADYGAITSEAARNCAVVLLLWFAGFGLAVFKIKDRFEEEEEED